MSLIRASVSVCLVVAWTVVGDAWARTWRVEQDGSGDFTSIQVAVDAAAEGDTIIVGPGQYTETTDFQVDCCLNAPTYVGIHQRNLTIRGVDRDSVVIGPDTSDGEMGLVMRPDVVAARIEDLTVQNLTEGIRVRAYARLRNIRFVNCWIGSFTFPDSAVVIQDCTFEGSSNIGVFAGAGSRNVSVLESTFTDCRYGMSFFDSWNPYVERVVIVGGGTGIISSAGAVVRVASSVVSGTETSGVELTGRASMEITDSDVESEYAGMSSRSGSRLYARRTRFAGGFAAFYLMTQRDFDLRNNVFVKGDSFVVYARSYSDGTNPAVLDFSENYWGTTDPDSIATLIWDGNDDPAVHALVEFEPLLDAPIPVETKSLSEFKSLFSADQNPE